MIPKLLEKNASDFDVVGIGALYDATSCKVTEERNGEFSLELEIPSNGNHASDIATDRIIVADSGLGNPQPFRITEVESNMDGTLTVSALHLTADLRWIPFHPFAGHRTSASLALADLKTTALTTCNFTFDSDITTTDKVFCKVTDSVMSIWDKLKGTEGSILQYYGGEYKYDKRNVSLLSARGHDRGVRIAYGKNITDFKRTEDALETYDSVVAFWNSNDANTVWGSVVQKSGSTFAQQRTLVLDASSDFQSAPTTAQLTSTATSYMNANATTSPAVSIDVSFVPLWQTDEYSDVTGLEELERVELCDTVTVDYEPLGISLKTKVVKTVYDVLLDRYDSIELGTMQGSLSQMLANMRKAIRYGR